MRGAIIVLTLVVAVGSFALSVGCIPGPVRPGSVAPPLDVAPTPAQGPRRASGGQRLAAALPADPAAVARAALGARGWTAHPSTRADEVIGQRRDNLVYVRWTAKGWWVRVDQRSDFATGERVPPWDHPWEALRLLHLLAPGAGPAEGWQAIPALPTPLPDGEAETLYRDRLARFRRSDEPWDRHLHHVDNLLQPLDRHALVVPTADRLRGRLVHVARAWRGQTFTFSTWYGEPAAEAAARWSEFFDSAATARQDPFTVLSPHHELPTKPQLGLEPAMLYRYRRQTEPDHQAIAADRLVHRLAAAWVSGPDATLSYLDRGQVAWLVALAAPGMERLDKKNDPERVFPATAWFKSHGRAWIDALVAAVP